MLSTLQTMARAIDPDVRKRPPDPVRLTTGNRLLGSVAWLPALLLPALALCLARPLAAWQYMWVSAFGIFLGVKWLTWLGARKAVKPRISRSLFYFFLWPGMDARSFLADTVVSRPAMEKFLAPLAKTVWGFVLLWLVPRHIPADLPLCRGRVGLIGLVLLLHFGTFELLALVWQRCGINATPIMQKPLFSRSLSDFWGRRWNMGFRQIAHEFIFRPLRRVIGVPAASFTVFLFSGLVHELIISVPARGGYGLPTAYFLLQGAGVALERSSLGEALCLRGGIRGWAFAAAITAVPAFWLFHSPFVLRVAIPFMEAIRAI